jgi:hypothetical protein
LLASVNMGCSSSMAQFAVDSTLIESAAMLQRLRWFVM